MECDWSQRVWFASPLTLKFQNLENFDFINWLSKNMHKENLRAMELTASIIYGIWKATNGLVFEDKNLPIHEVLTRSIQATNNYQVQNQKLHHRPSSTVPSLICRDISWSPPPKSSLKLNVDAHRKGDARWGLGFVLRRSDGRPVVVATKTVEAPDDPCMAEALGVKFALDWIEVNGWRSVTIESDAKKIVDGINKLSFSRRYWGRIGRCCLKKMRSLHNVSLN